MTDPHTGAERDFHTSLTNALDLLLDVICVVDADGCFVAVSAACEQVFGYTQQELVGKPFIEMVLPEDRPKTREAAAAVMAGKPLRNFENRYIRKDGQVIDILWTARWSESDQLRLAVAREITERKRAEAMQAAVYAISEAAHSATDLNDLLHRTHETIGGMLPTRNFYVALYDDDDGTLSIPYASDEFQIVPPAGKLDPQTPLGQIIRTGSPVFLTPETRDTHWQQFATSHKHPLVDWLGIPLIAGTRTIGALVVQSYSSDARHQAQHQHLLQFVSTQIAANIERTRANERLQYMAKYDILTGLPNRTLFDDRLLVALARASRTKELLALLYIDLDNFKPVNDNFGHAAGDLLLQEIARRIKTCVRESDTISRIGGDEFVVMLGALQSRENAMAIAETIRLAINLPFALPRRCLQISASLGLALTPEHGDDPNQLMRNADAAMYEAKRAGGNRCQVRTNEESTSSPER